MTFSISSPIIVLMLMIVIIGIFVVKGLKRRKVAKAGYWMFGVYVIVLLISVGVYYFIPVSKEDFIQSSRSEPEQYGLYDILAGEKPVESIKEFLTEEWEFFYEGNHIQIDYQGDIDNTVNIAVERTEGNSIKAAFYLTPIYGFDRRLTDYIRPVDIQLSNDQFVIKLPSTAEVEFTAFGKEFPLKQFKETTAPDSSVFDSIPWGEQLLYLQIPREVEIDTGEDVYLEYVNDK